VASSTAYLASVCLQPRWTDRERVPKMSDQRLCVLRCRASVGMSKRFIRTYSSSCVDEYYNYYVLCQKQ